MVPVEFGVVFLAAGKSTRMGAPKMVLPWKGTTVLGHAVTVWRGLGIKRIVAVCDPRGMEVRRELERLAVLEADIVFNPAPETGMFDSIRLAARSAAETDPVTHWIVALGDQPHPTPDTYQTLMRHAASEPVRIWQPSRAGAPRHPVVLPATVFLEIRAAQEPTFKDFLRVRSNLRSLIESDDPGLDCDLDTPADYEAALRTFPQSAEPS